MHVSIRKAVEWIALEDNPGDSDSTEDIQHYMTTALVADLFGKTTREIAVAVARVRHEEGLFVAEDK
jgi:hypothetical protein